MVSSTLRSTFTSTIFLLIFHVTRNFPKITLDFFDWAKFQLRFTPDLNPHSKTLLRPLIEIHSVSIVIGSMHRWFEGEVSLHVSVILVFESYVLKGCTKAAWKRLVVTKVALFLFTVRVRNGIASNGLTWDFVLPALFFFLEYALEK
ncbi:hypothetical protein AALP_AAs50770U000200 [Arabis alpina]|uniref:Uncharacterized protein n=1 Tax=Arabis alpina TaxID=50452 RepID=A0A087FXN9_ARAAL|nr:hypothetical protein AALP_AAs50770U000200 [Arabis alpina]